MIMNSHEFSLRAHLDERTLAAWVDSGWLIPGQDDADPGYSDIDLARAQLIQDLKDDLGVNDEGVAVILDLLDQIHGVRRTFREFLTVFCAQPEAIRRQMTSDIHVLRGTKLNSRWKDDE
jgi:chaperone modulatory protein CbpM